MTPESASSQPELQRELAVQMMGGAIRYIKHREGNRELPDSAIYQEAVRMLPESERELIGSLLRDRVSDHINADVPQENRVQATVRRLFGRRAEHPRRTEEIEYLQQHGQQTFTSKALLADLLMADGQEEEARRVYQEGLRIARERGAHIME